MTPTVHELDTPVPIVEVGRLERNVAAMAERVAGAGCGLRPHWKTHKTAEIARLQATAGARGFTVAKVGEAEALVAAGFDDVLIAYPTVGAAKWARILALGDAARIRFAVDDSDVARAAGAQFARAGRTAEVVIEVDSGIGRSGVPSAEAAVALAQVIERSPGIRLSGILGYVGGYVVGDDARSALGEREGTGAVATARAVREAGHDVEIVSVAGTATARWAAAVPGVTEVRPGNYVFHDCKQLEIGTATLDDCSLTVLASIVSHPVAGRYVLDAGIKTLAGEDYGWGTYGRLLERPDIVVSWASEEHGIVNLPPGIPDPGWRIGDRVRIVPNHACGVANMHDALIAVDGERVVDAWRVIGRGRVR